MLPLLPLLKYWIHREIEFLIEQSCSWYIVTYIYNHIYIKTAGLNDTITAAEYSLFTNTLYVDILVDIAETRLRACRRGVLLENVLHEKCMERAPDFHADGRRLPPLASLTPAPSSSCEYRALPAGYPIAEKGYKNRINRVYDGTWKGDNTEWRQTFWGFQVNAFSPRSARSSTNEYCL